MWRIFTDSFAVPALSLTSKWFQWFISLRQLTIYGASGQLDLRSESYSRTTYTVWFARTVVSCLASHKGCASSPIALRSQSASEERREYNAHVQWEE